MKILKEITPDWSVPNHTYFLTDAKDKMFAYIKASNGEFYEFTQPLPFSTSRRKFKEVENTVGYVEPERKLETAIGIGAKEYKVPGSKGNIYTVTDDAGAWACTCPASKWQKRDCKHVVAIKASTS